MARDDIEGRYRAPALEKGLDILELLAGEPKPLTMSQVSAQLGRSKGEIFRMLQVLEERGYISRHAGEDGYSLTNRLFMLGVERPPMRGLLEVSLPAMHQLSDTIEQSCHLAVVSGDQIVIVARVESPAAIGFSVRLGHRAPLIHSNSGRVLLAGQPAEIAAKWLAVPGASSTAEELSGQLEDIRARGYCAAASHAVHGVTDISAPIMQSGVAIAALTVPFVETEGATFGLDAAIAALVRTAAGISDAVRVGQSGALGVIPSQIERKIGVSLINKT